MKNKKSKVQALYTKLVNSMIGYEVNGNPEKRRFTLMNIANYIVKTRKKGR